MDPARVGSRVGPVGVEQPRYDELAVDQIAHVGHRAAVEHRIGEFDRHLVRELVLVGEGGERLVLLLELDAQGIAHENQREDDAHDAQRIGHGVAQRDIRILNARSIGICLLRRTESRGVRHGARKDADHRGDRRVGHDMDHVGRRDAQQHDRRRAAHQRHAAVLERREEAGPHLQSDREDEQDETELLDEVAYVVIDRHAEVAEGDAHEQNPGDPQRDASDLDLAQQDSERDGQRESQHRMRDAAAEKEVT